MASRFLLQVNCWAATLLWSNPSTKVAQLTKTEISRAFHIHRRLIFLLCAATQTFSHFIKPTQRPTSSIGAEYLVLDPMGYSIVTGTKDWHLCSPVRPHAVFHVLTTLTLLHTGSTDVDSGGLQEATLNATLNMLLRTSTHWINTLPPCMEYIISTHHYY